MSTVAEPQSAMTLDEQLTAICDSYETGLIDRTGAMDTLAEVTGWSLGMCARVLADAIVDRRKTADDWVPEREWDGRWTR